MEGEKMLTKQPKNIDSLIEYLHKEKGIEISNSSQKRQLMNMGYYHGYKGYRYIKNPQKIIPYSKFEELHAIYEFDAQLKELLYPWVMKIETALKNYVLEVIIDKSASDNFNHIYNSLLNNYKSFSPNKKRNLSEDKRKILENKFYNELQRRLSLRDKIYKLQTNAFGNNNKIALHYLIKDSNLPIWAIFELLSLGDFGTFVSCLNIDCRKNLSIKLGILQADDTAGMLPQRIIFAIKDLRNAIAHNDVIFDTRFCTSDIASHIGNAIKNATQINNLTFQTITDYLILIVYQLKLLDYSRDAIMNTIVNFEESIQELRNNIPIEIFNKIIYTDNRKKLETLKKFVTN